MEELKRDPAVDSTPVVLGKAAQAEFRRKQQEAAAEFRKDRIKNFDLRSRISEFGMFQTDLAALVGVDHSTVMRWCQKGAPGEVQRLVELIEFCLDKRLEPKWVGRVRRQMENRPG